MYNVAVSVIYVRRSLEINFCLHLRDILRADLESMAATVLSGVSTVAFTVQWCVFANSLAPYAAATTEGGLKKGQYQL